MDRQLAGEKPEPEVEVLNEEKLREELLAMKAVEAKNWVKERKSMLEGTNKAIEEVREKMKKVSLGSKEAKELNDELADLTGSFKTNPART